MINSTDPSAISGAADQLAVDANSLTALKAATAQNTPASIKETAKQFEALFVGMMMKSMRKATPSDGPLDSEQGKMFTSMLDQQISQKIAARGMGLADVIAKQMMQQSGLQYTSRHPTTSLTPGSAAGAAAASDGSSSITQHANNLKAATPGLSSSQAQVAAFKNKLSACAEEASKVTGIPANFMMGQAALETGWGKHEIIAADGKSSHNLFGIKAGSNWTGKTVTATTTEYVNGVATKKSEKFRAYDDYHQAFNDYAKVLQGNQRYQNVLANAKDAYGFAQGLQKSGYATDPEYAKKLLNVMAKTSAT